MAKTKSTDLLKEMKIQILDPKESVFSKLFLTFLRKILLPGIFFNYVLLVF